MNIDVEKIISEIDNADEVEIMEFDWDECFTTLRKMHLIIDCQNSLILDLHASLRSIKNNSVQMEQHCLDERNRILNFN
jgi:hypothetical protein